MSSIGVLASLMSQLGSATIPQYDPIAVQRDQMANQTSLLTLNELKRQQASDATWRQAVMQNPDLLLGSGGPGGSILGSLNAGTPGAITQGPLPGMPGATQTIGATQDLSRYAGVSPQSGGPLPAGVGMPTVTPPQSTIGSLGGPPPQDPLRALLQRDPDAGLKALDMQYKLQERTLGMQEKKMAYFGQLLQGATDQATWDQAREQIGRVDPQAAARMPQMFNKDVRDQWVQQALSVKDSLTLQVQDLQAQASLIKARKDGRSTDVDNQLRAMGVQPGQETPAQMREALDTIQRQKLEVSGSHGTGQIVQTPQGFMRVNPRTNTVEQVQAPGGGPLYPKPTAEEQRAASYGDRAQEAHRNVTALEDKGFTPGFWNKVGDALPFGMGNYLQSEDLQKYRQGVSQFAQAILRKESGAAISPTEYEMTDKTYFPQPGDSKDVIAQKRQARERIIKQLSEEGKQTGRQPPSGSPSSQAATTGKAVGQLSRDEMLSERDQLRKELGVR